MQQPEHSTLPFAHAIRKRFEQRPFQCYPVRRRVHFVFRELELAVADVFVSEKFYFLEADHLRADENVAVRMRIRRSCARLRFLEHAYLRVADGVGVVVDVHLFDVSLSLFEIEMFDVILPPSVKVDCFFMKKDERAWKIHFSDDISRASDINNYEIVAADRTETDRIGWIRFVRPVIVISSRCR